MARSISDGFGMKTSPRPPWLYSLLITVGDDPDVAQTARSCVSLGAR
jgi:hypothetical protein